MSAVECKASANIAELWVTEAAMNLQTAMATFEANPMSTTFFRASRGHVLPTPDLSQKMPGMVEDGLDVLTAPKLLVLPHCRFDVPQLIPLLRSDRQ